MLKKSVMLIIIFILTTGCNVTYNLDISPDGYKENLEIIGNSSEGIEEYAIPAHFGKLGYEDVDANFSEQQDGIVYYNSKLTKKDNLVHLTYNYKFLESTIKQSNLLNSSYETVIIKKYDHDSDGIDDYMLFTTSDDFTIFDKFPEIESVKINISSNYEVISNNADYVNDNIYTWNLTKNNIKKISLVYDPAKVIEKKSFWDKIFNNIYFSIVIILTIITVVGLILYLIIKKNSEKQNVI